MNIKLVTQPAPSIPPHIEEALESMDPRVFMVWNPRFLRPGQHPPRPGEAWPTPRWEIWVELRDSTHSDAKNELAEGDRWNPEKGCWMRRLQVYTHADGSFAPIDERLLVGLEMADGWNNKHLYEDKIARAWDDEEAAHLNDLREAAGATSRYYHGLDSTSVGRYVNSGWRHKIR